MLRENCNRRYLNESIVPYKGKYSSFRKGQSVFEDRFLYIYRITCIKTGRVYVGKHVSPAKCQDPLCDSYKGSGIVIKSMLAKHNWLDDFIFEILCFCSNEDQLDQAEIDCILQHRQQYGELCCNISDGGTGGTSVFLKDKWNDCQFKEEFGKQRKLWWSEHPEHKALLVERTRQLWSNDSFRQQQKLKMHKQSTEWWSDLEHRQQSGDKIRQGWTGDELRRDAQATRMKNINNDKWSSQHARDLQAEKMSEMVKMRWKDGTMSKIHCRQICCEEEVISPLNGAVFHKGHVFSSIKEAAVALGFSNGPAFSAQVMRHSKHPGEWIAKVDGVYKHISFFAYVGSYREPK